MKTIDDILHNNAMENMGQVFALLNARQVKLDAIFALVEAHRDSVRIAYFLNNPIVPPIRNGLTWDADKQLWTSVLALKGE